MCVSCQPLLNYNLTLTRRHHIVIYCEPLRKNQLNKKFMQIFLITFSIIVLIIVILAVSSLVWKRLNRFNQQLFNRAWDHERFLMKIYPDCSEVVQNKIESYLNSIKPL